MVNNLINVSAYHEDPPEGLEPRVITGGPIYEPRKVLEILKGRESTLPWTNKARQDMHRLALSADDLASLLKEALISGRYLQSEWCVQKPDGPVAACDAYKLLRNEYLPKAYKEICIEYYLKFAISKSGKVLLIVSCHLS